MVRFLNYIPDSVFKYNMYIYTFLFYTSIYRTYICLEERDAGFFFFFFFCFNFILQRNVTSAPKNCTIRVGPLTI
jgi:hypothetical protein